jgi:hypothetical protein
MVSTTEPVLRGPTEPGERRRPWCAAFGDLGAAGYEELEMLFSGTVDGHGEDDDTVVTAPYRSRLLIRRPTDPHRFSGRVLVEWLNVSGGGDIDVVWPPVWPMLVRDGWAYVGVTAQPWGVRNLLAYDPVRYGTLVHPGLPPGEAPKFLRRETFSEGVFSAAGRALRSAGPTLVGGPVQQLVAHGQSQSAARMAQYLATEQERAGVYDAFLVHAGGTTNGVPLPVPPAAKVLHLDSEAEVGRSAAGRQPDTDRLVTWEVAGTAHTPVSVMEVVLGRVGNRWGGDMELGPYTIEYALRAAVHHLGTWAAGGAPPPPAPPIATEPIPEAEREPGREMSPGVTMPSASVRVVCDELGNARGGVRLPHVEAPLGRHLPANGSDALMPGYVPFDAPTLRRLYATAADHDRATIDAADRAVAAGWLLEADVPALLAEAQARLAATGAFSP